MKQTVFKFFLLLFAFTSFYFGASQDIKKGDIVKDRQFLIDKSEITASDHQGNFVSIRPHRINGTLRNYFVEFYNNLNFTNRIEIETQNKTKILDVFILNKKAHVFIKEHGNKTISLRCDIIDLDSQSKTQKILYEIDKDTSSEIYKALKNDYNISLEYSSQFVLTFPVVEEKIKYAFVKIFSNELEELSQHNIYPDKTISHKNTSFLNTSQYNDKIYLLFNLIYDDNKKIYKLVELNNSNQKILDIPINIDTYELINSKINASQFIISGLYSKYKKGGFEGFTNYNINLDSLTITSQKQNKFLNEKASTYFKGLFKGKRSVDIKNVFIDQQQNTYVVGQFYIMKKQQVPIGIPIATIGASVFITYNPIGINYKVYDDLLIGKISPNGELLWDKILELRQTEKIKSKSNKRDSSTFTFFANNQINIFMNGFINTDKEKLIVKQDKRLNKTNFYNITINQHGGLTPNIVFPNIDSEIIYRAESAIKSNSSIHILGQGNMRKQLLNLSL